MQPPVRIIASSGRGSPGKKEKGRDMGAMGFLPKPYAAADMLVTIAEAPGTGAPR